jgi:V/A-type H+-transporting ATPase subunit I
MSIVKQNKVTLFGLAKDKSDLLKGLQSLGCMHLLPLVPPPKKIEKVATPKAENAYKALRFLSAVKSKRRQVTHEEGFDVDNLVEHALELKLSIRRASDKKAILVQRLTDIEPWGDIVYPPKAALADYQLWYYIVPLAKRRELQKISLPWQIVHLNNRFAYTIVLSKTEPENDLLPVPRIHVGAKPKATLLDELEQTEVLLDELVANRQALTRYVYLLSVNLAEADNRAALANASQKTFDGHSIVAVQGWVPTSAQDDVTKFAADAGLACLLEKPAKGEIPPTLLEQPKHMLAATDLAMFYQVPGYYGWDPSWLLFISFSLFFGMILADAGYGLLLIAGLFIYWKKLGASEKGKAYRLLGLSLTGFTVVYGALVGSYFGMSPPPGSLLDNIHILSINNFDLMMKLSIVIGAIHIGIANLTMAYVYRHRIIALSKLGWLAIIYGGLNYWLVEGNPTGQLLSYGLFAIGTFGVVLFSSERPVKKPLDYLLRIMDGIFSLKGLLNVFGDVLSYMRLFALGLASASLAMTFNDLAKDAYTSIAGGGLLIAILILLIGHGLNLILSLMSGVVHGLRLNYIEFYNWGQTEEGTPFQTFARKEIKP